MAGKEARRPMPPQIRERLRRNLKEATSRYATLAMGDRLDKRWEDFFLHAGISLELIAKAYLATVDTSLIAEGRSFDSLLHAAGRGALAKPNTRLRTIGADEALKHVGQILPVVANEAPGVADLIEARNGVAHVGSVGEAAADRALLAWFRVTRQMLGEAGWEEATYWGEYAEMVDARLTESADAAKVIVAELQFGLVGVTEKRTALSGWHYRCRSCRRRRKWLRSTWHPPPS